MPDWWRCRTSLCDFNRMVHHTGWYRNDSWIPHFYVNKKCGNWSKSLSYISLHLSCTGQERKRCKLWCASRKGASIPTAFPWIRLGFICCGVEWTTLRQVVHSYAWVLGYLLHPVSVGDEEDRLMHTVPAPAVRLMKRRVFSRPGIHSSLAWSSLVFHIFLLSSKWPGTFGWERCVISRPLRSECREIRWPLHHHSREWWRGHQS